MKEIDSDSDNELWMKMTVFVKLNYKWKWQHLRNWIKNKYDRIDENELWNYIHEGELRMADEVN